MSIKNIISPQSHDKILNGTRGLKNVEYLLLKVKGEPDSLVDEFLALSVQRYLGTHFELSVDLPELLSDPLEELYKNEGKVYEILGISQDVFENLVKRTKELSNGHLTYIKKLKLSLNPQMLANFVFSIIHRKYNGESLKLKTEHAFYSNDFVGVLKGRERYSILRGFPPSSRRIGLYIYNNPTEYDNVIKAFKQDLQHYVAKEFGYSQEINFIPDIRFDVTKNLTERFGSFQDYLDQHNITNSSHFMTINRVKFCYDSKVKFLAENSGFNVFDLICSVLVDNAVRVVVKGVKDYKKKKDSQEEDFTEYRQDETLTLDDLGL